MYNVTLGGNQDGARRLRTRSMCLRSLIDITVTGDNATGISVATFNASDTGFTNLFTAPPSPALERNKMGDFIKSPYFF